MGHVSNSTLRHHIFEDLKSKYQKQKTSLAIQPPKATTSSLNSASENQQQDFQTLWELWFDEVEQLEPELPKPELNEYGKALIDKYKQQGLDL